MEMVVGVGQTIVDVDDVLSAFLCLGIGKLHHRVQIQRQLSTHAIVALRRAQFDDVRRDIYHADAEILRRTHVVHGLLSRFLDENDLHLTPPNSTVLSGGIFKIFFTWVLLSPVKYYLYYSSFLILTELSKTFFTSKGI